MPNNKNWLLPLIAERHVQVKWVISFPICNEAGEIVVLGFDKMISN